MARSRVLVVGGYGVFGGRLARRLVREADVEVIVAGRSLDKAREHCSLNGGTPVAFDRGGELDGILRSLAPDVVVDAAGPFQAYGDDPYRLARAAIGAGAHYVDLADDADFVSGIAVLDGLATARGVAVISGASSVPAISSAALDALAQDFESIASVRSAIMPGNRAPRGLSVVTAIVAQVGRPLRLWRGGEWTSAPAWGDLERMNLALAGAKPLGTRLVSRIGAPDLPLFPARYGARSVGFHAGLELRSMHVGLWALAWLVRIGLLESLSPLAPALKWAADRLEAFGSDRGGMLVSVAGRHRSGKAVERRWTLIAEAGDGPEVPPTPALLVVRRLLSRSGGHALPSGAYPALGVPLLGEIEAELSRFSIRTEMTEKPAPPLMEQALPEAFHHMPAAWRRLAEVYDVDRFAGEASVERGTGFLSRLVGWVFGFPEAGRNVRVSVTKRKTPRGERWTRSFGGKAFHSSLSRRSGDAPGILRERFGPFAFTMRLAPRDGRVEWPVEGWRFCGVPMPRSLAPASATFETVGAEGRFRFEVGISAPLAGFVVRYRGWLTPLGDQASPKRI